MNQTKSDAFDQFFNKGATSSLAGHPSVEYLRALYNNTVDYLSQVNNALNSALRSQAKTEAIPVARAVRIVHENGDKFYFDGVMWQNTPVWTMKHSEAQTWLKDAKQKALKSLRKRIKIVHPKAKSVKRTVRILYPDGHKVYWNDKGSHWTAAPIWTKDLEEVRKWRDETKALVIPELKELIKIVRAKRKVPCQCVKTTDLPSRYLTINCPLSKQK
jgi:hypothetical protein